MPRATILLAPRDRMTMLAVSLALPQYERTKEIWVPHDFNALGAAEEMYDLTNNPSRQEERELKYGRGRSLSVGDVVEVEDPADPEKVHRYLCCFSGWQKLD